MTAKIVIILNAHSSLITALCLTRDENTLISGSADYTIKIWDWQKVSSNNGAMTMKLTTPSSKCPY
ncbi:MAG: WD40 domain-containing protein [Calothrix sp. FI2-JRJ7]|nr:WD40 domain-containing protein [Calothrix sp. FI2-JRJ7]